MNQSKLGTLGAIWGLLGVSMLLGSAVFRLTPLAVEAFRYNFKWYHWLAFVLNLIFMAYSEGYSAFQKGFSPRVVARSKYLHEHPTIMRTLFAPFFCMGYFHATKKRKIIAYTITSGVIVLIILVRQLAQPWRGIIDTGVVVGLTWGVIAIWTFMVKAFTGSSFVYPTDVPEEISG